MEIKGQYKKAGEPTNSLELSLVKSARDSLSIWQYTSLDEMYSRLKNDIESIDRWEFQATQNGEMVAMLIVDRYDNEPHTGHDILYTKFAFSTNTGALAQGYRWMKRLAKALGIKFIVTTRQTGSRKIEYNYHEVK
ncbi:hypothetical protein E2L92_22030 [Salmonella enterica subsp. enterica serovar Ibadan]|nr:hypothetical protein [Salmonella enterica subsp. enterica serovar Ibadan]